MFVRITYLTAGRGSPVIDSYILEAHKGDTFEDVQRQLMEAGFRCSGELYDPHVWIMPTAIINLARCDAEGRTDFERKQLERGDRIARALGIG